MFDSIIPDSGLNANAFFIILLSSLVIGIFFSFINSIKSRSSKGFFITTAVIPLAVSMVILLVNGQIGTGIAVAGAFSLVRFRSSPGTAKEICIIFIAMALGLATGMGYILYALIFAIVTSLVLFLLEFIHIFDRKTKRSAKIIKIMIPEELDYPTVFNDIFDKYLKDVELLEVKSKNMGSMFLLKYSATLLNPIDEKKFIDEIRIRNGNLEIMISRADQIKEEL